MTGDPEKPAQQVQYGRTGLRESGRHSERTEPTGNEEE